MPPTPATTDGHPAATLPLGWRLGRLALALTALAVVWLVVLPYVATTRPTARLIERMRRERIDPSALFYTELAVLPEVLARLDRLDRERQRAEMGEQCRP